jgi:molybdopterin-guanine dinucleotide biosynthesis protein B
VQFDRVIIVDWSAAGTPTSATNKANSIWVGVASLGGASEQTHHRTRHAAEAHLNTLIAERRPQERLLIGFDFAFGYPSGFAATLTGQGSAQAVWAWLSRYIRDSQANANNRFEVAAQINAMFLAPGPFWGHPRGWSDSRLPDRKSGISYADLGLAQMRQVEARVPGAKSPWMLYNPGAVGSQSLMGLPLIHRLTQRNDVAVWPFSTEPAPIVLAEVYPSLLGKLPASTGLVLDQAQVKLLSEALLWLSRQDRLGQLFVVPGDLAPDEGWILGADQAQLLHDAALQGCRG